MSEDSNITGIDWIQRDSEVAMLLTPVVAFVSIVMTSGVIGNSLVCYICYVKWKERKIKYFIGTLATLDLLTCCVCMPMEIAMLSHPFILDIDALCKLQRFSRAITSLGAGVMLVIIAVDRYISICKHTKARIQASQAKWLCFISVLIALVFSWPSLILFGKMDRGKHVIAETSCSTSHIYDDTSYPMIYYLVIFILFFLISLLLVVFYSLIWLRILRLPNLSTTWKRQSISEYDVTNSNFSSVFNSDIKKKSVDEKNEETLPLSRRNTLDKKQTGSVPREKSWVENSQDSCDLSTDLSRNNSIERKTKTKKQYYNEILNKDENIAAPARSRKNTLDNRNRRSSRKSSFLERISLSSYGSSRNMVRRRRITITMFIITIVQILSFLPYISLLIARSFRPQFLNSLDPLSQIAYNIGILSHFFSSGVNPWVYGFCSKIFRREFKKTFCKKLRKFDIYNVSHV